MKITALSPQFIREPRASADTDEEAASILRDLGDKGPAASGVDMGTDSDSQSDSPPGHRSREGREDASPGQPHRAPFMNQESLRRAVVDAEATEAALVLDEVRESRGRGSLPSAPLDPVAEVLRKLAYQAADDQCKKQRALASYARFKEDPTKPEPETGFRVDRAG